MPCLQKKNAGLHIRGLEQGGQQICGCDAMCADCSAAPTANHRVTDLVRQGSQVWTSWVRPRLRRPVQLRPQRRSPVLRWQQWLAVHCRPQMHRQFRQLARSQSGVPSQVLPRARLLRPAESCAGPNAGLLWHELISMHNTLLASTPDTIACGKCMSGLTWRVSTRVGALVSVRQHTLTGANTAASKRI